MPEGHTVHRIALQFTADFVGRGVTASSPQGRFAAGAALLDGATMTHAHALGKHLILAFERAEHADPADRAGERRWLRVHLGLYGAWDFAGHVSPITPGSASVASLGAPRVSRVLRMGEDERELPPEGAPVSSVGTGVVAAPTAAGFPADPVGQVRLRLLTASTVADLRGPIVCEVLTEPEVAAVVAKAGPDPQVDDGPEAQERFVRGLTSRATPVGVLLMDQSVVSGIGNVYRAEMLFRARLDPFLPGRQVPADVARALWRDWVALLDDGVRTGLMVTREDLDDDGRERALADPAVRHAVYRREGEPCRVCGTPIAAREVAGRRLYWCPACQA